MSDNVFTNTPKENQVDIDVTDVNVETLVGEEKKYKTPDDLARAYVHADAHIGSLKADLAEKDTELKVLKDLLESVKIPPNDSQPGNPQTPPAVVDQKKNDEDLDDFAKRFDEKLSEVRQKERFESNVQTVSERLVAKFGSTKAAEEFVAKKAAELKVDKAWLGDVAGRSPEAFFNTIGLDTSSTASPGPSSDVNISALSVKSGTRNFSYYDGVRKENPNLYYSPAFQKQLFTDARTMGTDFYKR